MLKTFSRYVYLFTFLAVTSALLAQSKIDSLEKILKTKKEDTSKVRLLWKLCILTRAESNEAAMNYGIEALNLSHKLNSQKATCYSYHLLGETYAIHGDFSHAIEMFEKMLAFSKEANDTLSQIKALNGMANSYQNAGNVSEAYLWNKKCLELAKAIKDPNFTASSLGNIGSAFLFMAEYPKALDYYLQALKIFEEINHMNGLSASYGNIALIHDYMGDFTRAMEYNEKSLAIDTKLGKDEGIAAIYGNMASILQKQKELDKAGEYHRKSLFYYRKVNFELEATRELLNLYQLNAQLIARDYKDNIKERNKQFKLLTDSIREIMPIFIKANDKAFGCVLLLTVAEMQIEMKEYKSAENNLKLGLGFSKETKLRNRELDFYNAFIKLYKKQKKYEKSTEYLEKFREVYTTVLSEKTATDIAGKDMLFTFNKKVLADSLKNEADKKLKDEEIKNGQLKLEQERIIEYSALGGLAIVLVFSILLFKRFKVTSKQKEIIEEQKKLVEEKQEAIVDSINYARRIQKAFMSNERYIEKKLRDMMK